MTKQDALIHARVHQRASDVLLAAADACRSDQLKALFLISTATETALADAWSELALELPE